MAGKKKAANKAKALVRVRRVSHSIVITVPKPTVDKMQLKHQEQCIIEIRRVPKGALTGVFD